MYGMGYLEWTPFGGIPHKCMEYHKKFVILCSQHISSIVFANIIGKELNPDSLRRILNEEDIKDTDWPEIGKCLIGQDLRNAFIGGIIRCPFDKTGLWHKLAQNLEGMEAAALKARKNAGT